jgi:DNA polymerase IV
VVLRWLVLDLNSFFASCEQQENPELRGKPVIVVPAMAETTCAIAASYPAKAFGIKTGTLVHEARRLCPGLKLVRARHKLYVEYHHRILDAIDRHIPVEDVMSIDEVACRLDRVQQEPAAARALALRIKREIHISVGEGLTSSIGISANRLLAKLASNMQKPDGLTMLQVETLPHAILHLELRDIPGIGPNMAERLRRAGSRTLPCFGRRMPPGSGPYGAAWPVPRCTSCCTALTSRARSRRAPASAISMCWRPKSAVCNWRRLS